MPSISTVDTRAVALGLAVSHHNAANVTRDAIQARPSTVVNTATVFEAYILGKNTVI